MTDNLIKKKMVMEGPLYIQKNQAVILDEIWSLIVLKIGETKQTLKWLLNESAQKLSSET
jgi:hypothetical protein